MILDLTFGHCCRVSSSEVMTLPWTPFFRSLEHELHPCSMEMAAFYLTTIYTSLITVNAYYRVYKRSRATTLKLITPDEDTSQECQNVGS